MMGVVLCVLIYVLLAALGVPPVRHFVQDRLPVHGQGRSGAAALYRRMMIVLFAFNTLAMILFLTDKGNAVHTLKRAGIGKPVVTRLKVSIEGVVRNADFDAQISARDCSTRQARAYLSACRKELPGKVLGKNKDADHVTKDLTLPEHLPDNPTVIRWRADRYDVLDAQGKIIKKALVSAGTPVTLTASLTCGKLSEEIPIRVTVRPAYLKGRESYLEETERLLNRADQADLKAKEVKLPERVGGRKTTWRRESGRGGYALLAAGVFMALFIIAFENERGRQKEKERERMMDEDYPKILNLFALLLRAGMTPEHVWALIVSDYESTGEKRPAFEAMAAARRKMKSGYSREEVYLDFGRDCRDLRYDRLGRLLAENLRHGSAHLAEQLAGEASGAFEERKAQIRVRGEEAQTKLLLPMLMLLAVVLLVVMIPAFLSMQMT